MTRTSSLALVGGALAGVATGGCSDDKKAGTSTPETDGGGGGTCTGGTVSGAADTHCGSTVQEVGACMSGDTDAGMMMGDGGMEEEAAVLYGTEGDDDDCKYHVKIEVPALCEGKQAVIKLTLTSKSTNKGVTGAA
ncbi:MAG TPA: hypothetical protein VHE30_09315, partial [Polyangiaceae bacterium]|nr:hypothetical protein [Polyangiaceae bacterium]